MWRLTASQRGTCRFQRVHCARRDAGARRAVARVNGQPERVIDTPSHLNVCETYSSAAREWAAWLSPISATEPLAPAAGTPNWQGMMSLTGFSGVHGRFGVTSAMSGVGTTSRVRRAVPHGRRTSREAAPKQRWRAAGATATLICRSASPLSGSRSSQPPGGGQLASSRYWLRALQWYAPG